MSNNGLNSLGNVCSVYSSLSQGQQFLMNSQQCVKERLLEYYRRDYVNCHRLEHNAIAMISPCYIDNGFCDIIVENSQQFIEVFEFNDLFRGGSGKYVS